MTAQSDIAILSSHTTQLCLRISQYERYLWTSKQWFRRPVRVLWAVWMLSLSYHVKRFGYSLHNHPFIFLRRSTKCLISDWKLNLWGHKCTFTVTLWVYNLGKPEKKKILSKIQSHFKGHITIAETKNVVDVRWRIAVYQPCTMEHRQIVGSVSILL